MDAIIQRFQRSVDTLSMLTRYEANRPGRKLLVWIGSGWPLLSSPSLKMRDDNQQKFFRSIVDLSSGHRDAQMTVYSITPLDLASGNPGFAYREYLHPVTSPRQAAAGDLAVQVLAVQSGGLAIGPTGDIKGAIDRVVDDLASSYELTFVPPPDARPGTYHSVNLTLRRPGLTARTVAGYYAEAAPGIANTASR